MEEMCYIMIFYHGTDKELKCLNVGSYITKNFKDACKFGYRRAVLSNSSFVYIYKIEISEEFIEKEFIEKDTKRDRAFIILISIRIELNSRYPTYQAPYKLKKFNV